MKYFASLALVASLSVTAHDAPQNEYHFAGDVQFAAFCKAAVFNDVGLLKRSLSNKVGSIASTRKNVLRKLLAEDGMTCNGVNLVEFSKQVEANHVLDYLVQQK